MVVYQTDKEGFLVGPVNADESPLEPGVYLIPGGCTTEQPPEVSEHQACKLVNGVWEIIPDFRGFEYWLPNRTRHVIAEAGIEPPPEFLNEDPGPTQEQITETLKRDAQILLDKSDRTVCRCYESGVPVPQAWRDYRNDLRAIVSSGEGAFPERPAYPSGT